MHNACGIAQAPLPGWTLSNSRVALTLSQLCLRAHLIDFDLGNNFGTEALVKKSSACGGSRNAWQQKVAYHVMIWMNELNGNPYCRESTAQAAMWPPMWRWSGEPRPTRSCGGWRSSSTPNMCSTQASSSTRCWSSPCIASAKSLSCTHRSFLHTWTDWRAPSPNIGCNP